jgi:hypothetical protein
LISVRASLGGFSKSTHVCGSNSAPIMARIAGVPLRFRMRSAAKTRRVGKPPDHEYTSLKPYSLKNSHNFGPERYGETGVSPVGASPQIRLARTPIVFSDNLMLLRRPPRCRSRR